MKGVIVLEYDFSEDAEYPGGSPFAEPVRVISHALREADLVPQGGHIAIKESADKVLAVFEEEEMLRKHGEGEVLPESEQQKQAAKRGMAEEDRRALQEENERVDRDE